MRTGIRSRGSWKWMLALVALSSMLLGKSAMTASVAAQDAATTADSPIVGVWIAPPMGEETGSITTFSSDGALVDQESDGTAGLGSWEATGPTSGTATFVFFASDDEFTGNVIIRAALEYDAETDSLNASYTVTGMTSDGTVVWSSEEASKTALTRLPVQGPEMGGQPIDGLVSVPMASPEATPSA